MSGAAKKGRVYLLGAGPGDPELITARALRRLAEADLDLYDALVHVDLLAHAKPGAELVFVGKRAGRAAQRQAEINAKMLEAVREGRVVARLKGGDPYLFGRGSEEAELLAREHIEFEVVPGVPSPIAAAAYAGISLTHRELASSVAYVTATESIEKDESAHDWTKLATATQTLVLFMGARKLESLMERLVAHGRSPSTPAAVIQSASLPSQRVVVGTVGDIAVRAREAGIAMPALTIVGDVVRLRDELRWFDTKPLFGRRILVTRPRDQARALSELLRDEGAEPIEVPAIRIAPPDDAAPLERAAREAGSYDWIVFTSANGADAFFAELARQGADARRLARARVCAIGPATARAIARAGVRADIVPDEHRGEAVAEAITRAHGRSMSGARILLPRAAVAREVLPEMLGAAGASVDVVVAYRTLAPEASVVARLAAAFEAGGIDVVTFTSSSTVDNLVDALGARAAELLARTVVASIGPITTETAARSGVRVDVTAAEYTAEGLVRALVEHFASRP